VENKNLYRLEYEEYTEEDKVESNIGVLYLFLDEAEYQEALASRGVLKLEPATPDQTEAYTLGFEDGVDVATIKYRLEDSGATHDNFHAPTEEELLDIFREEEPK